jgi:hypothetical protein
MESTLLFLLATLELFAVCSGQEHQFYRWELNVPDLYAHVPGRRQTPPGASFFLSSCRFGICHEVWTDYLERASIIRNSARADPGRHALMLAARNGSLAMLQQRTFDLYLSSTTAS